MSGVFGVHLDGLDVTVAKTLGPELADSQGLLSGACVPMGAVLSPGVALRIHRRGPIPLDGAGMVWPDEAGPTDVHDPPGTGRIPVAFLWERFLSENDSISGRQFADRADRALAMAVREALHGSACDSAEPSVAIVIPNELDEGRQQKLLDACGREGLAPVLLWRPVAAALAWLELHAPELIRPIHDETSVGSLLCVHVGLDGAEAAWLKLILRPNDARWILPARTRPGHGAGTLDPSLGRRAVEQAIEGCLPGSGADAEVDRWRALWASPLLLQALADVAADQSLEAFGFEPGLKQAFLRQLTPAVATPSPFSGALSSSRRAPRTMEEFQAMRNLDALESRRVTDFSVPMRSIDEHHALMAWAKRIQLPAPEGTNPLGAVVTGSFASLEVGQRPLGAHLVEILSRQVGARVECEGSGRLERGALARAAATFLARRNAGRPTYLDALPQMEVLIEKRAVPTWHRVFDTAERYVDGGRPHPFNLDLAGLLVKAGRERLSLDVWTEGERFNRTAQFPFPESPKEDVAVQLTGTVVPAGGRARVELRPLSEGALGRRPVVLVWENADVRRRPKKGVPIGQEGVPSTRETTVEDYPRRCPEVQPRVAWPGAWQYLEYSIRRYEANHDLSEVRRALNASRPNTEGVTPSKGILMQRPLDSEGLLHPSDRDNQGEIEAFKEHLLQRARASMEQGREIPADALACLGYLCATGPIVDAICEELLAGSQERLKAESAYFLAGCARQEVHMDQFACVLERWMKRSWTGFAEVTKSLGYLLQWREYAADAISSSTASELLFQSKQLLALLVAPEKVVGPRPESPPSARFSLFYRNALVLIAFLLRRRIADSTFLPPDSDEALRIKEVLEIARRRTEERQGDIETIGGMVSTPKLIKQVSDYVDEKGTGPIVSG